MRLGIIGECMIELYNEEHNLFRQSFGGDTFNTAFYLTQCICNKVEIQFITNIGDDVYSDLFLDFCKKTNISLDFTERLVNHSMGLYIINTDKYGERNFQYWRNQSPAKKIFTTKNVDNLIAKLKKFDWLYLSAITLAILSETGRARLYSLIDEFKKLGGKLIFDANYRPKLWENNEVAQGEIMTIYKKTDIALPSIDDERLIWQDCDLKSVISRIHSFGCNEVILKRGQESCVSSINHVQKKYKVKKVNCVIDTTAAGDSFNAGYMATRLFSYEHTKDVSESIAFGQKIAKQVITQKGAIVPIQL